MQAGCGAQVGRHESALDPMNRRPGADTHSARIPWLDVARGIGIILVVVGHSLGGLISAGHIADKSFLSLIFFCIYTFHMPLFFVLSGLFVEPRLETGYRSFFSSLLVRIVYPYFLWGTIQNAAIAVMGSSVNTPLAATPMLFLKILWAPPSQFWFLYSLFIFQLLVIVFHRFSSLTAMVWMAAAARLLPEIIELPAGLDATARNWIYFAIAVRFAPMIRDRALLAGLSPPVLGLSIVAWICCAWLSHLAGGFLSIWNVPAALLGVGIVLRIAQIREIPFGRGLIELGLRSMPIFVTHVLIVAGIRILFDKALDVTDPYLVVVVASAVGILLPCWLSDWARRRGLAAALALK